MLRLTLYAKSISFPPPYRSLGFRSDGVPSVRLVLTFVGQARQLILGLALTALVSSDLAALRVVGNPEIIDKRGCGR
jgi:hypothetical protein